MHLLLALLMTGIDHSSWDALLKKYVSGEHRVDYGGWKANDLPALDAYLETLAKPWPSEMSAGERKAAFINAYNALTVRWILANYPVKSIWKTKKPFITKRHPVDGKTVSLDDVENGLRDLGDPRVHAVLVCAARSCPPLRREAYIAARLEEQMDDNTRAWLANPALNKFDAGKRTAEVSSIFEWFKGDFEKSGGTVPQFLARYAPAEKSAFLKEADAKIKYLDYQWGLNDTTTLGADYGGLSFYWDWFRNK
jgi:hypothetical protein